MPIEKLNTCANIALSGHPRFTAHRLYTFLLPLYFPLSHTTCTVPIMHFNASTPIKQHLLCGLSTCYQAPFTSPYSISHFLLHSPLHLSVTCAQLCPIMWFVNEMISSSLSPFALFTLLPLPCDSSLVNAPTPLFNPTPINTSLSPAIPLLQPLALFNPTPYCTRG